MKQIQSRYKNKLYHLHQAYLKENGRPKYVSLEDWNWLIKNKWSGSDFGGFPTLRQRNESFDIRESMSVHCGYVS